MKKEIKSLIGAFAFLLVLAGCQKEDVSPSIKPTDETMMRKAGVIYPLIIIEHSAARTMIPAYKVELESSGDIIFTGISNTAFIGIKRSVIPEETVDQIRTMVVRSYFYEMPVLPYIPDLPTVTTTFQENINVQPVVRYDYTTDQYNMEKLVDLRTKIENMLNINNLVRTSGYFDKPVTQIDID